MKLVGYLITLQIGWSLRSFTILHKDTENKSGKYNTYQNLTDAVKGVLRRIYIVLEIYTNDQKKENERIKDSA